MAMWLTKKKKGELVSLCNSVGLSTNGLKKPELETVLAAHLHENQTSLWSDPNFAPYYESLSRSTRKARTSPPKLINPVDPVVPEGTTRARRRTSRYGPGSTESAEPEAVTATLTSGAFSNGIKEEVEPDDSELDGAAGSSVPREDSRTGSTTPQPGFVTTQRVSRRIVTQSTTSAAVESLPSYKEGLAESSSFDGPVLHTPSSSLLAVDTPRRIPLPPSPAVVAALIETKTVALREKYHDNLSRITPQIKQHIATTRHHLSNILTVAAIVNAYEALSLVRALIPASQVVIPSTTLGAKKFPYTSVKFYTHKTQAVHLAVPDLFRLLEWERFWAPVLVWVILSVIIPGFVGYFVNLTRRSGRSGYLVDPVVFALTKGLVGWAVFYKAIAGDGGKFAVVEGAVGKEVMVVVGSSVLGLMSLWEAVLG